MYSPSPRSHRSCFGSISSITPIIDSSSTNQRHNRFTLVLKDLVNGVPTAFQDLESLLTNSEQQLQKSYKHLPDFLQKLIEQLPSKFTGSFGPEILATMAEKQGLKSEYATQAAGVASKMGMKVKVPNLKDLVTKPGAVAGMLRAIMNFLKLRFPAFMGMNVLLSLALFGTLYPFPLCLSSLPAIIHIHIHPFTDPSPPIQSSSLYSGTAINAAVKSGSSKNDSSPKPSSPPSRPKSPQPIPMLLPRPRNRRRRRRRIRSRPLPKALPFKMYARGCCARR